MRLLLAGFFCLVLAAPAAATEINVTTRSDTVANDGRCSLREAVGAANFGAPSGPALGECPAGEVTPVTDVIVLGDGQYLLSRAGARENLNSTGDLDVLAAGPLAIRGLGRDRTIVSADGIDRVIDVLPGTVLSVADLAIVGGAAPDGADATTPVVGGAGEPGGGILSAGALELRDSAVRGNRAGRGGIGASGLGGGLFSGLAGGAGGDGGGIASTGELTLIRSLVADNRAGGSGRSGDGLIASVQSPAGGNGGGIAAAGPVTVTDSTIQANRAGAGADGGGGGSSTGAAGSAGGRGGGITTTGATTITGSSIVGNATGAGGRGGSAGQFGGNGGAGGRGGGVLATGVLVIAGTLIASNATGDGGPGGNAAQDAGNGGSGGGGAGLVAGDANVTSSTIVGGATGAGAPGGTGPINPGGISGLDTAIDSTGTVTLARTIVDGTCSGAVDDVGGSLGTATDCGATIADPRLDAAGVPGAGSPAIDATASCPPVDVAGTARPQGAACDIGALEAPASPVAATASGLDFASLTEGTATTLSVNVTNPGLPGLPLTISVVGDPEFTLAGHTCGAVLAAGSGCAVTVRFAPVAAGTRTGTLRIADGVLARPLGLPLTAVGLAKPSDPAPQATARCVVPRLKGKTLIAAARSLQNANCKLGKVTRRGRGRQGRVRSFSPKAGTSLPAGTTVRLVLNRRPRR